MPGAPPSSSRASVRSRTSFAPAGSAEACAGLAWSFGTLLRDAQGRDANGRGAGDETATGAAPAGAPRWRLLDRSSSAMMRRIVARISSIERSCGGLASDIARTNDRQPGPPSYENPPQCASWIPDGCSTIPAARRRTRAICPSPAVVAVHVVEFTGSFSSGAISRPIAAASTYSAAPRRAVPSPAAIAS